MDDDQMTRLVNSMAQHGTILECLSAFRTIMNYEGIDEGLRTAILHRAWEMLGDRRPLVCTSAPFSLFHQGSCRTQSDLHGPWRFGF
jgi:hypothetical protein